MVQFVYPQKPDIKYPDIMKTIRNVFILILLALSPILIKAQKNSLLPIN